MCFVILTDKTSKLALQIFIYFFTKWPKIAIKHILEPSRAHSLAYPAVWSQSVQRFCNPFVSNISHSAFIYIDYIIILSHISSFSLPFFNQFNYSNMSGLCSLLSHFFHIKIHWINRLYSLKPKSKYKCNKYSHFTYLIETIL